MYQNHNPLTPTTLLILILILTTLTQPSPTTPLPCRTSCGKIPISYPFSIDDGCGSPYYRHLLLCSDTGSLHLRTPSGNYPIHTIVYTNDPHLLITDPTMWTTCSSPNPTKTLNPFTLDTSTHLSLSPLNEYLFFNCSPRHVIVAPKPVFCLRSPEKCDSSCDSSSYLCRNLPGCGGAAGSGLEGAACCSYYPKATESVRLMLRYCGGYSSVYWRSGGGAEPEDQVAEYGVRVDFEVPVTARCLQCQDMSKGGGSCGFDVRSQEFLCLCGRGNNVTTFCNDRSANQNRRSVGVIAGTVSAVSVAGVFGIGACVWYLFKVRAKAPVTCGVQSNENRLF